MFDIIGDIHGHAAELRALLVKMGYVERDGIYSHPDRRVLFLGDFIDRGPEIPAVVRIVRGMVEAGFALAVMGNHELNALAYHTPDGTGGFLRPHNAKNDHQHSQTLKQFAPADLRSALDWFRTLPLWLDLPGLRAVHACWDDESIAAVGEGLLRHGGITEQFLRSACLRSGDLFEPVEILLKGKEMPLPEGRSFRDKDGTERHTARSRWYLPATRQTYRTYAFQTDPFDCDDEIAEEIAGRASPYPPDAVPVFVGHYWLSAERPTLLATNVACLDFSVAKGGFLCAYRWEGERILDESKFIV